MRQHKRLWLIQKFDWYNKHFNWLPLAEILSVLTVFLLGAQRIL